MRKISWALGFVGFLISVSKAVLWVIDRLSEVDFMSTHWGAFGTFLATGWGTFATIIGGCFVIALAIYLGHRERPATTETKHEMHMERLEAETRLLAEQTKAKRVAPQPVYVGLNEAAMRLHEALEAEGVEDATGISCKTPEQLLEHYKYVLITQARERQIMMEGTRQPSRVHRTIPPDDYAGLYPVPGTDILTSRSRADSLRGFDSVRITAGELGNAIKERIELLKRLPRT